MAANVRHPARGAFGSGLATLFALAAVGGSGVALAQPSFENPSPVAAGSASQRANAMADRAAYKPVAYVNAGKRGPQVVVLPGLVKSDNATFAQRYLPDKIADFAELELARANFSVLERADLGGLVREFELAYNLGDPQGAQRILQRGKLKATRWVVIFDILKAEPVATAEQGFDGGTAGSILEPLIGGKPGWIAGRAVGSVRSEESARVWLVGMRYRILDASSTARVATGYHEQKMEVGVTSEAVLGAHSSAAGGLPLDTLVQRLVQLSVYDVDSRYK